MKLAASLIATACASHYRGGTYQITPNGNRVDIVTTHTWRQDAGGFSPKCTQADVANAATSGAVASAKCSVKAGGTCDGDLLRYTVLFAEEGEYCYGDGLTDIAKPSGPYTFGWNSCCWVALTTDGGSYKSGGSMIQRFEVNDLTNTSPSFKLPPLWMIMSGCDGTKIDLAPIDADGDKVKCRWATKTEAGGAYNDGSWPSLTLDEDKCIVTYNGSQDQTQTGVKAIALMMEDFDAQGNVRSSVPVQFLGQVWTPSMNSRSFTGYPDFFGGPEAEEHVDNFPVRGRRSTPSYCSAVPKWVNPTPADGHVISTTGSVSFTLAASSENGSITSFSYQPPAGMQCTTVNGQGQITCNWTLTSAQMGVASHAFCYDATDALGLKTTRQCLTIEPSASAPITNISEMSTAVLDGSGQNGFTASNGKNYGCAGRGNFAAFTPNAGKTIQVDPADVAFNAWKHCIKCAGYKDGKVPAYSYDKDSNSCANSSADSRAACECDKKLVNVLYDASVAHASYNGNNCSPTGGGSGNGECCNYKNHQWARYNSLTQCCDPLAGVKDAGSC